MYKEHQFTQLQGAPRAFRASSEVEGTQNGASKSTTPLLQMSIVFTAA